MTKQVSAKQEIVNSLYRLYRLQDEGKRVEKEIRQLERLLFEELNHGIDYVLLLVTVAVWIKVLFLR